MNNLENDKKKLHKEFNHYIDHLNEKSSKLNSILNSVRPDLKIKGFNDFFSNNYSGLSFKTKPAVKTKVVKKNEKFNE